jgi:hypothetical protein
MSGINRLQRILESANAKPSFFSRTHYAVPTDEQLEEIHNFPNLTAKEIYQGFGYSIIGRGMRGAGGTDETLRKAHAALVAKYPDNPVYKEAAEMNLKDEAAWWGKRSGK